MLTISVDGYLLQHVLAGGFLKSGYLLFAFKVKLFLWNIRVSKTKTATFP